MPRELTGAGGEIAWRAEYRAWGNTLRVQHIATRTGEPVYQPLRYQGQYFDAGTGLHYNRFRYYDPDAGRLISQNPPGLAGGINLYQYTPNPLVWVDPLGLSLLLSGERHVGPYGKLPGYPGDNLTGDHMASAEYIMKKFWISKNESIAMQIEEIYPENKGRHPLSRTYFRRPFLHENARDALARDIGMQ